MRDMAWKYMARGRLEHIDMLEIMRRGSDKVIYAGDDGVLMQDTRGKSYLMSAENRDTAGRMLDLLAEKPEVMDVHQEFILPLAEDRFGLKPDMQCYQSMYTGAAPERPDMDIRRLDMSALERVTEMYSHGGPGYLEERISEGEMYGAYAGGELAGFIGTHAEGAMGLLEVVDAYRRHGVGSALFRFMTGRQLELGRFPYSHIQTHNEASLAMHRKYGWTVGDRPLFWLV